LGARRKREFEGSNFWRRLFNLHLRPATGLRAGRSFIGAGFAMAPAETKDWPVERQIRAQWFDHRMPAHRQVACCGNKNQFARQPSQGLRRVFWFHKKHYANDDSYDLAITYVNHEDLVFHVRRTTTKSEARIATELK
jgi:hypothetical protein